MADGVHMFCDDGDLIDAMRANGFRTVLCIGKFPLCETADYERRLDATKSGGWALRKAGPETGAAPIALSCSYIAVS
jgi:hypothetical protein